MKRQEDKISSQSPASFIFLLSHFSRFLALPAPTAACPLSL